MSQRTGERTNSEATERIAELEQQLADRDRAKGTRGRCSCAFTQMLSQSWIGALKSRRSIWQVLSLTSRSGSAPPQPGLRSTWARRRYRGLRIARDGVQLIFPRLSIPITAGPSLF